MFAEAAARPGLHEPRNVGKIPVRNIWLLFLYASDLAKFHGLFEADIEQSPDFPELIARLLCFAVEKRLMRNLSRGYRRRERVLTRVRGRIDVLKTYSDNLLNKGAVACRFEEHTLNTPRNRLVRSALDALATRIGNDMLAHQCRRLANDLGRQGVSGLKPSRSEITSDQIGRHDSEDILMVELAKLVFDLVLPTEDSGEYALTRVQKDEALVRNLFEKAVGNFFSAELSGTDSWSVYQGKRLNWQIEEASDGIATVLPGMVTDIVLENYSQNRRVVIDTKFTGIFARSEYRDRVLKSGYIYQLYAYLRSQERSDDDLSYTSEGILLHPTIDADVDETVRIQRHNMRFVTIDLSKPTADIISRLRSIPTDRLHA